MKYLPKINGLHKVLEIGPGLGHLGKVLQNNLDYYAADLVPNYLTKLGLESGKAYLWDVTLGGIQSKFDAIVACDVFEHVLNEGDAYVSIHDALKKGGLFYLRVPYREPLVNYSTLLGAPYPYVHLRSYTLTYLKEMCSYSGFRVIRVKKRYNFEAGWARRDFGVPFLRTLRSRTEISQLKQAYLGNLTTSRASQGKFSELGSSSHDKLSRMLFSRMPIWLQSLVRVTYKLVNQSTVILFFRPVEIALVLQKRS